MGFWWFIGIAAAYWFFGAFTARCMMQHGKCEDDAYGAGVIWPLTALAALAFAACDGIRWVASYRRRREELRKIRDAYDNRPKY